MQVDAPPDENDTSEEEMYIVENPTLVCFNFLCKIQVNSNQCI